jgi:hypothetical protein
VWRQIWLEKEQKRYSPYIMSTLFLKEKEVHDNICRLWTVHQSLPFYNKIRRCVKYYRRYCLRKATERKYEEEQLRNQLENKVDGIQNDPNNLEK